MEDGRKVQVLFTPNSDGTSVTETFEAEQTHPAEMQRAGWQAILDNFKSYVEGSSRLEHLHFGIAMFYWRLFQAATGWLYRRFS